MKILCTLILIAILCGAVSADNFTISSHNVVALSEQTHATKVDACYEMEIGGGRFLFGGAYYKANIDRYMTLYGELSYFGPYLGIEANVTENLVFRTKLSFYTYEFQMYQLTERLLRGKGGSHITEMGKSCVPSFSLHFKQPLTGGLMLNIGVEYEFNTVMADQYLNYDGSYPVQYLHYQNHDELPINNLSIVIGLTTKL